MPPLKKLVHRARAKLANWSIPLSDTPTSLVVVANGGVMNGIGPNQLEALSEAKITVTSPKKRSYAYVVFDSAESAENLVQKTSTTEVIVKNSKNEAIKVFAFYVEKIPEADLPVPCPRKGTLVFNP